MLAYNEMAPPFFSSPSSTETEERLNLTVFYFTFSFFCSTVIILSLGSYKHLLICNVGVVDTQIHVRYLVPLNHHLSNTLNVIAQALISARSCFLLLYLAIWLLSRSDIV